LVDAFAGASVIRRYRKGARDRCRAVASGESARQACHGRLPGHFRAASAARPV